SRCPAAGGVVVGAGVGAERRGAEGGVGVAGFVAPERVGADGGVVAAAGVVKERLFARGGVVGARGVAPERNEAAGGGGIECGPAAASVLVGVALVIARRPLAPTRPSTPREKETRHSDGPTIPAAHGPLLMGERLLLHLAARDSSADSTSRARPESTGKGRVVLYAPVAKSSPRTASTVPCMTGQ